MLNAAEEAGFDLLLTTDKNIRYQQNLAGRKLAIVVLGRQQWPQLRATRNAFLTLLTRPRRAAMQRWISRSNEPHITGFATTGVLGSLTRK